MLVYDIFRTFEQTVALVFSFGGFLGYVFAFSFIPFALSFLCHSCFITGLGICFTVFSRINSV